MPQRVRAFLSRPSLRERGALLSALRTETVGGALLLAFAVIALIWANSPLAVSYQHLREFTVGPEALHLNLSLQKWASDGLLAIFFFVAGIELKRELTQGELRDPRAAALPIVAAVCGMATPALIYVLFNLGGTGLGGWAIPTATDIAFALAVLAIIGTALPTALRAFLLTLAVVDDLGAIIVIAVFYTASLNFAALAAAAALLAVVEVLQHRGVSGWWWYLPLALAIWALVHASGVHATVAGVAMGLLVRSSPDPGQDVSPAERLEHQVRPLSAGFAVPAFALMATGVSVSAGSLAATATDRAALGVVAGLFLGKMLGVFGGAYAAARLTRAELNPDLRWADVFAVAVLAGIGFTVSLLIAELAFAGDPARLDRVKAAVLLGSLISTLAAAVLLRLRNRRYRRLCEAEDRDDDGDGIPDVYQTGTEQAAVLYQETAPGDGLHRRHHPNGPVSSPSGWGAAATAARSSWDGTGPS